MRDDQKPISDYKAQPNAKLLVMKVKAKLQPQAPSEPAPEEAYIDPEARLHRLTEAVQALSKRTDGCVVSGHERPQRQRALLMFVVCLTQWLA